MRQGGGKQKGAVFERETCVKLSYWISGGKDKDLFWRSAMSGGRATINRRQGIALARQAGDITATAPEGHVLTDHFYVECKRWEDLDFGAFLTKQQGKLAKFWQETVEQAVAHGRIPMLIAREDRNETVLIVPNEALLERGRTGITFHFPADALVARMMFVKADMYMFEDVLKKPFHPPSRWKDEGGLMMGPMLKPGELARILAGPAIPVTLDDAAERAVLAAAERNGIVIPGKRVRQRFSKEMVKKAHVKTVTKKTVKKVVKKGKKR